MKLIGLWVLLWLTRSAWFENMLLYFQKRIFRSNQSLKVSEKYERFLMFESKAARIYFKSTDFVPAIHVYDLFPGSFLADNVTAFDFKFLQTITGGVIRKTS